MNVSCKGREITTWRRILLYVLVLVLPASAIMIASLQSKFGVESSTLLAKALLGLFTTVSGLFVGIAGSALKAEQDALKLSNSGRRYTVDRNWILGITSGYSVF